MLQDTVNDMNHELMNESVYKLVLKYSLPCISSMLVSSLYSMVDQIFIGQGIGYLANGATNVIFPITTLLIAFSLLIGDGSAAYLSICQGQGNNEKANRTIGNGIFLGLGISFLLSAICLCFHEQIIWSLGGTQQNFQYAKTYFQLIVIGFPFLMFTNMMSSLIRASGSPGYAMFCTVIGCVVNLILDPVAIFLLDMGIAGAAIATVAGQVITAGCAFWFLMKKIKIKKTDLKLQYEIMMKSLPLGISSFFTQVFILIISAILNIVLVKYGALSKFGPDIPLTAVGIVMKVYSLVISFIVGLAVGVQPIVGYNYGAKQYQRVREVFKVLIVSELSIGIIATIIFELFPVQIISLFGNESNLYNEYAIFAFRVYFSTIILCALQKSTSIFLQALGKPGLSMGLSLLRDFVISIPSVFVMSHFLGVYGAVFLAPVSDVLSFIAVIGLWFYVFKILKQSPNRVVTEGEAIIHHA